MHRSLFGTFQVKVAACEALHQRTDVGAAVIRQQTQVRVPLFLKRICGCDGVGHKPRRCDPPAGIDDRLGGGGSRQPLRKVGGGEWYGPPPTT